MKSDFDTIKSMITCNYCGEIFKKENKALILKCAHSICQYCHRINLESLICLTCKIKYIGKENSEHPVNFLLVEFLEKEDLNKYISEYKNKTESSEITDNIDNQNDTQCEGINKDEEKHKNYYCTNCNLFFRNEFHFKVSKNQCAFSKVDLKQLSLDNIQKSEQNNINENKLTKKEILMQDSEALMNKYNEFNKEINELYEDYMILIIRNYLESQKILIEKINSNALIENLILSGILPENHFTKLLNFVIKYHKNTKLKSLLRNINSSQLESTSKDKVEIFLQQLYSLENNSNEFVVNQFLSDYFFFKKTLEDFATNFNIKLNIFEDLLKSSGTTEMEKELKKNNLKGICEMFNRDIMHNLVSEISNDINFSEQIDVSNIKYSHFFINKNSLFNEKIDSSQTLITQQEAEAEFVKNDLFLVVFDPLTESIKKFDFEKLINKIQVLYEKYNISYTKNVLYMKYLKNFDFNYDQFGNLFLFGGYFQYRIKNEYKLNKLIFKINPFKKKFNTLYELSNPKFNSASLIINHDFYFLGGTNFQNFISKETENSNDIKNNINTINKYTENKKNSFGENFRVLNLKNFSLNTLKEYPMQLSHKPLMINHVYENIFVCEDIKNFAFYNLKSKKWRKSQIFYTSEISNIRNFIGFNYNKNIILLGGMRNLAGNDIKENTCNYTTYNDQIFSIDKESNSASNIGYSQFDFVDLYEQKFGKNKDEEMRKIQYDVSFLSDSTYIIELHQCLDLVYIKKNMNLKRGIVFDSFKIFDLKEI